MTIDAKPLSGFPELTHGQAKKLNEYKVKLAQTLNVHGYTPTESPCILKYEVLTGGHEDTDKQIFNWKKTDDGTHLGLRFDLTVPFAAYIANNFNSLVFPFKRCEIGKVWRGERAQKGRYREFYQCDFDIVGSTAISADLQIMRTAVKALADDLEVKNITVKLNNIKILKAILNNLNFINESAEILRILDKFEKVKDEGVRRQLLAIGIEEERAVYLLGFLTKERDSEQVIKMLRNLFKDDADLLKEVDSLEFLATTFAKFLAPDQNLKIELYLARGLGYYTGTIFEIYLTDSMELGSVCSGGRYDDLTSRYGKTKVVGVGASIGLSRLFNNLDQTFKKHKECLIVTEPSMPADLAYILERDLEETYQWIEVYPQTLPNSANSISLSKQLAFANKEGFNFAIIIAPTEYNDHKSFILKDMNNKTQEILTLENLKLKLGYAPE